MRAISSCFAVPSLSGEVDEDRREVDHGAGEAHDADEDVSAGLRDARELRHRLIGPLEDVAERTAEADRDVEGVVLEARKVGDVAEHRLDVRQTRPQKL